MGTTRDHLRHAAHRMLIDAMRPPRPDQLFLDGLWIACAVRDGSMVERLLDLASMFAVIERAAETVATIAADPDDVQRAVDALRQEAIEQMHGLDDPCFSELREAERRR